ncbi:MAG: hypothetical protein ACFBSE_15470 [Prochloraceae cyanobacterium]
MTTLNNKQQITLDRSLFDLIINCLLANAGGDASCKHILLELGRSGLYSGLVQERVTK